MFTRVLTRVIVCVIFAIPFSAHASVRDCDIPLQLHIGSSDTSSAGGVSKLQRLLADVLSPAKVTVSGYFGVLTKESLREYQKKRTLPQSGLVDQATRASILGECGVANDVTGSFSTTYEMSLSSTPTIHGYATSTIPLRLEVYESFGDTEGSLAATVPGIPVEHAAWRAQLTSPLHNGPYRMKLYAGDTLLDTAHVQIGFTAYPAIDAGLSLSPIGAEDGKLMRFGIRAQGLGTVSVGKLTFTVATTGLDVSDVQLYGFRDVDYSQPIGEDGAPLNAEPITPDTDTFSLTFNPAIEIPSGESRYFELSGSVTPTDSTYSISTRLRGDTKTRDFATFDDMATSSNFVWSTNTYEISSTTLQQWTNGANVPDLGSAGISVVRTNEPLPALPPTCAITADTSYATSGQPVLLTWWSDAATSSIWGDGTKVALQGSKTVYITQAQTYSMNVYGPGGFYTCVAKVYPTPVVATSSPLVVDSLSATPTSGRASLKVSFTGTINASSS